MPKLVSAPTERKTASEKRTGVRELHWPNSESAIWSPDKKAVGYARVSRLLPLIMMLIGKICPKGGNPASVYLDLWCRDMGESLVQITDEEECAYCSGYATKRAVRTWREHMRKLVSLEFIQVQKVYNREFGYVLLLNPLEVAAKLHAEGKVEKEWWSAFSMRAEDIGATIPKPSVLQFAKKKVA